MYAISRLDYFNFLLLILFSITFNTANAASAATSGRLVWAVALALSVVVQLAYFCVVVMERRPVEDDCSGCDF